MVGMRVPFSPRGTPDLSPVKCSRRSPTYQAEECVQMTRGWDLRCPAKDPATGRPEAAASGGHSSAGRSACDIFDGQIQAVVANDPSRSDLRCSSQSRLLRVVRV